MHTHIPTRSAPDVGLHWTGNTCTSVTTAGSASVGRNLAYAQIMQNNARRLKVIDCYAILYKQSYAWIIQKGIWQSNWLCDRIVLNGWAACRIVEVLEVIACSTCMNTTKQRISPLWSWCRVREKDWLRLSGIIKRTEIWMFHHGMWKKTDFPCFSGCMICEKRSRNCVRKIFNAWIPWCFPGKIVDGIVYSTKKMTDGRTKHFD